MLNESKFNTFFIHSSAKTSPTISQPVLASSSAPSLPKQSEFGTSRPLFGAMAAPMSTKPSLFGNSAQSLFGSSSSTSAQQSVFGSAVTSSQPLFGSSSGSLSTFGSVAKSAESDSEDTALNSDQLMFGSISKSVGFGDLASTSKTPAFGSKSG